MQVHCHKLCALAAFAATVAGADGFIELGGGPLRQSGFLQTPAGGQPSTASHQRPSFGELALDEGAHGWLAGGVDFGGYRLRVRYDTSSDDGDTRLATALTSQGRTFATAESLRASVSFDGLALAVTRSFEWDGMFAEVGGRAAWTEFDLAIRGSGGETVDRRYTVNSLGLVGIIGRHVGKRLSVAASLVLSPSFDGGGVHHVFEPRATLLVADRVRLAAGLRLERFRYDDSHKQALPNRLRANRRIPIVAVVKRF